MLSICPFLAGASNNLTNWQTLRQSGGIVRPCFKSSRQSAKLTGMDPGCLVCCELLLLERNKTLCSIIESTHQ